VSRMGIQDPRSKRKRSHCEVAGPVEWLLHSERNFIRRIKFQGLISGVYREEKAFVIARSDEVDENDVAIPDGRDTYPDEAF
jgi:hypothetical protein